MRRAAQVTSVAVVAGLLAAPVAVLGDGSVRAIDLLAFVEVQNEHRGGYVRDLFGYPADFGHGCDTRAKVLERDSTTPPSVQQRGCTVLSGTWRSPAERVRPHSQPAHGSV